MQTIQKYVFPESRATEFVRACVKYDVNILMSYSTDEMLSGVFITCYIMIQPGEIPHELKAEKMKEQFFKYQKQIQ